jgi:hypothetical protein
MADSGAAAESEDPRTDSTCAKWSWTLGGGRSLFPRWATVSIEEDVRASRRLFFRPPRCPSGRTLSGGKLKSGIGRLNRQHAHAWDFLDAPWSIARCSGDEGFSAQVCTTWLAPTPFSLLFGTEVFNGDTSSVHRSDRRRHASHDAPRLCTAFMKTGPDL